MEGKPFVDKLRKRKKLILLCGTNLNEIKIKLLEDAHNTACFKNTNVQRLQVPLRNFSLLG